ncbi:MAG: hypothetical protein EOM14_14110 [Clostridia bacterium]|nr:hypothetical protein [Clostridia bacterium]
MIEKYLAELVRVLKENGIDAGPAEKGRFPVLLCDKPAAHITTGGEVLKFPGDDVSPEASELYHKTASLADTVREYVYTTERAPVLSAERLEEDYRLLSEFNGIVMAGRETENGHGYNFVTWQRTYQNTGLTLGHYYGDNYAGAKEDFAVRTGLVDEPRMFTNEQLTEMYRCMRYTLAECFELTREREALIDKTIKQIENAVLGMRERFAEAQEAEKQQHMNMEM